MAAADAATVAAAAAALVGQMAGTGLASNGSEARGATEGVPPVLPGADPKLPADDPEELFQEKPDEVERGFYDDLIAAKIPGSLVWYMSNENINSLEDLPNYCLTKESILETLIQACFPTRNERKLLVPLGKMWDLAKASSELGIKRRLEGVTDASLEVPLPQEDVDKLNRQHRQAYGFALSDYGMMWPHMLGRLQREISTNAFSTIPLNRVGALIEGGKSHAAKQWSQAPGVTTTVGGMAGKVRTVENNHVFVELLQILMNCYVLLGNFSVKSGGKWCSKAAAQDYFEFVKYRACPINHQWPDLAKCLNSEWQSRSAWLPHLKSGKSLTEAIEATKSERSGMWVWATPVVASAYTSVAGSDGGALEYPSSGDEGPSGWKTAGSKRRNRPRSGGGSSSTGPAKASRVTHTPNQPAVKAQSGKLFCAAFNSGGCSKGVKCQEGKLHACNFVGPDGKVCGLTGHRRCNHPDHGVGGARG